MASGTKKRRKSQSPACDTASKRARVTSKRTQHAEPNSNSSRAGSVKDTYRAQKQGRSISLPTGDDWVFRVKVISSATDLGNDLFKNAVQGLVRICFPEGILDQLGPQVLEQHMREEKAPEQNIERMGDLFRSEMAQRVASMIAGHLDTAAKVDSVLGTILFASARAHGDNLGEDILGYVTDSLLKLKVKASERSTEWLAGGDAAATEEEEEGSSDGESSTNDISNKELTPPPKTKKPKKRDRKQQRARSKTPDDILEDVEVDNNVPATLPKQHTSKNKDRKISSTWKWHVDAAELADEDVADTFPRTSDLFAYHALPISQRKLGPSASKKEIRCEMQSLLDGTPQEEFEKWVESLQKLLDGDRDMLERQESTSLDHQQQLSRVTPAPIDTRRHSQKATGNISGSSTYPETDLERGNGPSRQDTFVKREVVVESMEQPHTPNQIHRNDSLSEATATLRQVSLEESRTPLLGQVSEQVGGKSFPSHASMLDWASGMKDNVPVTLLLWGKGRITQSQCQYVTRTIMYNLNRRVSAGYIRSTELDGTNKTLTKSDLQNDIVSAFSESGKSFNLISVLRIIESKLVPWAIVNLSAFPEVRDRRFVFTKLMTDVPIAVDLLFGSWSAISAKKGHQVWESLLQALQRRRISEKIAGDSWIKFANVSKIVQERGKTDWVKCLLLERTLRRLAFAHKVCFPELKATPVVMAWERKTGLIW